MDVMIAKYDVNHILGHMAYISVHHAYVLTILGRNGINQAWQEAISNQSVKVTIALLHGKN